MELKIRRLNIEDYSRIVEIWEKAGLPYKPKGRDSYEEIKRQMTDFGDLFLGAEIKDTLVGVIIGSSDGRKGWLNRIAVDPTYQGMGIAKMLTRACEEALKKRGLKIFAVLIESYNKNSLALAKKMGYVLHKDIFYLTKRESKEI